MFVRLVVVVFVSSLEVVVRCFLCILLCEAYGGSWVLFVFLVFRFAVLFVVVCFVLFGLL